VAVSRFNSPPALDKLKWNVVPAGDKDGLNTSYTTPDFFVDGTLRLYINGQRLLQGGSDDFTTSESGGVGTGFDTVTIAYPPRLKDNLLADYVAA
jgi:hypothetical protein